MGTIGVAATLRMKEQLASRRPGVMFVDAPVSGSKGPAQQGQLLILASGPAAAAGAVRPVFDVIGRKTVYMAGIVVMAIWGFVYFGLYATAVPLVVFVVIALSLIPHDMQYGPQASLIAESFTGRLRYSGASLGYQLASVIAGGPAPYIATGIWAGKFDILGAEFASPLPSKNPYMISLYILGCCVIGFIAVLALRDRSALDHTVEYEEQESTDREAYARRAMG